METHTGFREVDNSSRARMYTKGMVGGGNKNYLKINDILGMKNHIKL